jgi:hypothetical protein
MAQHTHTHTCKKQQTQQKQSVLKARHVWTGTLIFFSLNGLHPVVLYVMDSKL